MKYIIVSVTYANGPLKVTREYNFDDISVALKFRDDAEKLDLVIETRMEKKYVNFWDFPDEALHNLKIQLS